MKYKISAILISCMLIFNMITVFADTGLTVKYQTASKTVNISGNIGEIKELINITILPADVPHNSITADIILKNKYLLKTIRSDADGQFADFVVMPAWALSGIYTVYVNYGEKELSKNFSHINDGQALKIINLLNLASKDEFKTVLMQNTDAFGIEQEQYNLYKDSINECLFAHRPLSGYTVSGFVDEYSRTVALNLIAGGSIETTVEKYGQYFGVSYEYEFKGLSEKIKSRITFEIAKFDFAGNNTQDVFMKSYILAQVSEAASYVSMQETILKFKDYIGINLSKYTTLSNYKQGEVFSDMFDGGVQGFDNIKPIFDKLVSAALSNNTAKGGASKSGGGYSNNFSLDPITQEQTEPVSVLFNDMENHWGRQTVYALAGKGIISGFSDGNFKPDNKISRAEYIKLLVKALDISAAAMQSFDDVKQTDWFYSYVVAAKGAGLASGFGNEFKPNDEITREDAAVLLYRAIQYKNASISGNFDFADNEQISDYAKEAVSVLGANNIISGFEMKFIPKDNTSRAEAAALLYRMLDFLKEV